MKSQVTGMTRPGKSRHKRELNPRSAAIETDALTTRPTRRFLHTQTKAGRMRIDIEKQTNKEINPSNLCKSDANVTLRDINEIQTGPFGGKQSWLRVTAGRSVCASSIIGCLMCHADITCILEQCIPVTPPRPVHVHVAGQP